MVAPSSGRASLLEEVGGGLEVVALGKVSTKLESVAGSLAQVTVPKLLVLGDGEVVRLGVVARDIFTKGAPHRVLGLGVRAGPPLYMRRVFLDELKDGKARG